MQGNPWREVPDADGLWWLKHPDGTLTMALILPQEAEREAEFVYLLADDHTTRGDLRCLCRWHEYLPQEGGDRVRHRVSANLGCWARVEEPPGLH